MDEQLGPLDQSAKKPEEELLATARPQSYGEYWNLYVVNPGRELGEHLPIFDDLPVDLPGMCRK